MFSSSNKVWLIKSVSECVGFNVPLDTLLIGHLGDESFQAMNFTGTGNQK